MPSVLQQNLQLLAQEIGQIVKEAKSHVRQAINRAMVLCYWDIGRLIIEYEQKGKSRAAYGKEQLQTLSKQLSHQFGKGFDITNLRNMRRFYQEFPIRETLSLELSCSHYNHLARIENSDARQWYLQEAVNEHWSVRALQRQISVFYYERLLCLG